MTGCQETMCSRCVHLDVCKYKELFLKAQGEANNLHISEECPDGHSITYIRDIPWIRDVELSCRKFAAKGGTLLRDLEGNPI